MQWQLQRADVVAAAVLLALAGGVGTGLGLASANVRAKNGPSSGPLRVILRGSNEIPSLQRDRVHLQRSR
jgi:amino acid permease